MLSPLIGRRQIHRVLNCYNFNLQRIDVGLVALRILFLAFFSENGDRQSAERHKSDVKCFPYSIIVQVFIDFSFCSWLSFRHYYPKFSTLSDLPFG